MTRAMKLSQVDSSEMDHCVHTCVKLHFGSGVTWQAFACLGKNEKYPVHRYTQSAYERHCAYPMGVLDTGQMFKLVDKMVA